MGLDISGRKKKGWQLSSLLFWNFKRCQLLLWGLFFFFLGLKQWLCWLYCKAGPACRGVGDFCVKPSFEKRPQSNRICKHATDVAQYSALVDDSETLSCFFTFHEIRTSPRYKYQCNLPSQHQNKQSMSLES